MNLGLNSSRIHVTGQSSGLYVAQTTKDLLLFIRVFSAKVDVNLLQKYARAFVLKSLRT